MLLSFRNVLLASKVLLPRPTSHGKNQGFILVLVHEIDWLQRLVTKLAGFPSPARVVRSKERNVDYRSGARLVGFWFTSKLVDRILDSASSPSVCVPVGKVAGTSKLITGRCYSISLSLPLRQGVGLNHDPYEMCHWYIENRGLHH